MTIDEISHLVAERLLQGTMYHDEFINYYSFLGLEGYKLFHKYHFIEETLAYQDFINYFITTFDKLIPKITFNSLLSLSIIPDNWYNYTREDTDTNTRRNAIKNGLEKYVSWEKETKKFLEDMFL